MVVGGGLRDRKSLTSRACLKYPRGVRAANFTGPENTKPAWVGNTREVVRHTLLLFLLFFFLFFSLWIQTTFQVRKTRWKLGHVFYPECGFDGLFWDFLTPPNFFEVMLDSYIFQLHSNIDNYRLEKRFLELSIWITRQNDWRVWRKNYEVTWRQTLLNSLKMYDDNFRFVLLDKLSFSRIIKQFHFKIEDSKNIFMKMKMPGICKRNTFYSEII